MVVRSENQISTAAVSPPFRRIPRLALGIRGFWFGLGESFSVSEHDQSGRVVRTVSWDRPNRPVTDEMINVMREEMAQGAASSELMQRTLNRMFERVGIPRTLPAFGHVIGDEVGNVWVREYPAPGESSSVWNVFAPDGRLLGPVSMPPGLEPTQIGADFVLGVRLDDDDIPLVVLFRLVKP